MVNEKLNKKRLRENRYRKAAGQSAAVPAGWPVVFLKLFSAAAAIAVMSLVFVFGYDWVTQCDFLSAQTIEIKGIKQLERKQVLEAAKISEGVNILSVNLSTARRRMLSLAWAAETEIRREFPDKFMIRIREHEPVAVIELGKIFLVNAEGEIFREADRQQFPELPLIAGAEYEDWVADNDRNTKVCESVMFVIARARQDSSVLTSGNIEKIMVDRELGLTLITGEYPAEKIHLGFGEYESKYQRLSKIISFLNQRGADVEFKEIDLRYRDRIVARPAGEAGNLTTQQKGA
ncbi:MAG: cell division protein FtsQ/DivIB [Desulfobacterales bacterium]